MNFDEATSLYLQNQENKTAIGVVNEIELPYGKLYHMYVCDKALFCKMIESINDPITDGEHNIFFMRINELLLDSRSGQEEV